jgi:hypothetical protein
MAVNPGHPHAPQLPLSDATLGPQTARRAGSLRGHDHSPHGSATPKPLHRPIESPRVQMGG